jgi:putative aminopeptidase FrvX
MELLKKLAETNAPSGSEENVRKIISEEAGKYADDITVDTLGNLIVRKKGPGKRIMLTAHMDEPGVIATVIDDKGFVYFSPLGSVKPGALHGSKMVFLDGSIGIAASKAEKYEKTSDLYIDPLKKNTVSLGDSAVFATCFEVCGSIISGKAISSRAGCYILLQTLKSIQSSNNDLYFVFTVQHLLGSRGAGIAASRINPGYAISIGAAPCDDVPGGAKLPLKIGEGPSVKIMDNTIICHPVIKRRIIEAAKAENIKIQYEISEKEGSDSGAIHLRGAGAVSGAISIPIRYYNTAFEIADLYDVNGAAAILKKIIAEGI